jgi:hypothetical protein
VRELVLDMRYNGGGYLYIASELATMIAGNTRTAGRAFETLKFSAKRSGENETPFFNTSCILVGNRCTQQQPLPVLNLDRVYVLASRAPVRPASPSSTACAAWRGRGADRRHLRQALWLHGQGQLRHQLLPIEFSGVNDQGFGDYADGFEPTASGTAGTRFVKGCTVADDTGHALGDPSEAMLASALGHVDRGSCPPAQPSARCARRTRSAAKAACRVPPHQRCAATACCCRVREVRRGRESRPDRVHPAQQCQRLGMRHARALDPARADAGLRLGDLALEAVDHEGRLGALRGALPAATSSTACA